jgi:hypothetical protein
MVSALLAANLSADPRLVLVERADLKKILGEAALGLSGDITSESVARIGQLTGTKVLVTGQVFSLSNNDMDQIVVVAKVIGTETGRVFAQTEQGSRKNTAAMSEELSKKIAQIIIDQSTNLIANPTVLRETRLAQLVASVKVKPTRSIFIKVDEQNAGTNRTCWTTETELGLLFQRAGFTLVDEKSERKPDVTITGDIIVAFSPMGADLFSCHATTELKAQERQSGKILALDRQESVAVDLSRQAAAQTALENAADDLAKRLLPLLAQ